MNFMSVLRVTCQNLVPTCVLQFPNRLAWKHAVVLCEIYIVLEPILCAKQICSLIHLPTMREQLALLRLLYNFKE